MPIWDSFIDEAAIASVLPDEYAHFRRPIAGALTVFLDGLPAVHLEAVLADQASLPPAATAAQRLGVLAQSCPALHKLGQILARDRRLSPDLRQHLQGLESLPPSVPLETMQAILAQELGPLERLGVTLLPPAIAEASVAVVIPFRQDRGPREEGCRDGVFKLLKPGIEERLAQELELVERVGVYPDEKCDEFRLPHLDYRESFAQVRDKLRHEVRLDLEQQHLAQAGAFYRGEPRVQIPALFEHCTPRVTAMERVTGGKVTDHGLDNAGDMRRLAGLIVEALIARPVFSPANRALFHGDPHAGNLFLTEDHRLAILDWSLVGTLGERERIALGQITLGALTLSAERIVTALAGLAERRHVNRPALESVVDAWLGRVRRAQFPGFAWLMGLLDEAFQTARLRVGGDLMLFRKTLHTLEGVLADVHAGTSPMDEVLLREFVRHLAVEWPQRWVALPPPGRLRPGCRMRTWHSCSLACRGRRHRSGSTWPRLALSANSSTRWRLRPVSPDGALYQVLWGQPAARAKGGPWRSGASPRREPRAAPAARHVTADAALAMLNAYLDRHAPAVAGHQSQHRKDSRSPAKRRGAGLTPTGASRRRPRVRR